MVFNVYRGLPRPVYFLFASRIVNRMGDFVRVFLTIYLTRYLGYSEGQTGLLVTLSVLGSLAGSLVGGKVSDRSGRKKIMLTFQTLSALFVGICGFIPDSPALPGLLIVSQFFFGAVRPVNGAMLIDLSPPEKRQRAFSLLYLGINLGAAVGPMLAGFLFNNFRRWIFWGDALTTLGAMVLVLITVPEVEHPEVSDNGLEAADHRSSLGALIRRPDLLIFLALSVISSLVYSQHSFALPLQMESLFGSEGPRLFGLAMSFNAVTVLAVTPLLLKLLEKRSPLQNIRVGALLYAVGFGLLFLNRGWFSFFLATTLIWTLGEIVFATNAGVFVASLTPVNHRGRFNAFRNVTRNMGGALSPLLAGQFLAVWGFSHFWIAIACLSLVQYLGLLLLGRRMDRRIPDQV